MNQISTKLGLVHQAVNEMKRINRIAFIVIIGIVFLHLLYKAVILPVVTDESITVVNFVTSSVWDIIMYTDHYPNNHILNTLITKLFVAVFGNEQLIIRLPNLLSFLLYGFGIFRINRAVLKEDSIYFLPAALLFVTNPYLLDFFGLCRGYGMSCALVTLASSYLITAFKDSRTRHAWMALLLSILASYANFTLLVFWVSATLMIWLFFILSAKGSMKRIIKPTVVIALVTVSYLALIANPIIRMNSTDEFQFWSAKGFYQDTIIPLIEYSRSGSHLIPGSHIIAAMAFIIIVTNLIYIAVHFYRSLYDPFYLRHPVFVTTAALLITVFINLLQCWLLKTPNLHGRTALFFYPLFIIVVVSFLGTLPTMRYSMIQRAIAVGLAFICIFHVIDRFKLNWVRDNWQSVNTFEVLEYLKNNHTKEPVTLVAYSYLYHSFNYYVFTGKVSWLRLEDYNERLDIHTKAEYYYIFRDDIQVLEPFFKPVKEFGNNRVLMKREKE